jgi:ABC-type bacteriocin/lantibiotic exporter with double-glycine peptidase domain
MLLKERDVMQYTKPDPIVFLILVEATSILAEETANAFGEMVNVLRVKVTIVLIAHRLPVVLSGIESIHLADKQSEDYE